MCLKLKLFAKPKVATEDIVVYKHLNNVYKFTKNDAHSIYSYGPLNTVFKTPFRNQKIKIGENYKSALCTSYEFFLTRTVEEGLHSFKDINNHDKFGEVICQCIIPKGAKYYKGWFSAYESYASDSLTYIKTI